MCLGAPFHTNVIQSTRCPLAKVESIQLRNFVLPLLDCLDTEHQPESRDAASQKTPREPLLLCMAPVGVAPLD